MIAFRVKKKMETILKLDDSLIQSELAELHQLLAVEVPLDRSDLIGKVLNPLIGLLESGSYVVDIERLPAFGTGDIAGRVRLNFTDRFRELVSALRAAYGELGISL
jgi:hypothetical protein